MYSSDNSFGFMNTPAYFSIDNFTTGQGVGIAENSIFENLNVFPNPANDILNINLQSEQELNTSIKIYNSLGVLVKKGAADFNSRNFNYSIDVANLNSGLYFIEITSENKKQNTR